MLLYFLVHYSFVVSILSSILPSLKEQVTTKTSVLLDDQVGNLGGDFERDHRTPLICPSPQVIY